MMKSVPERPTKPGPPEIFWGEIAPSEHLVQFYDEDEAFLDSLEGFVSGGLRLGESVIVIATKDHIERLEQRIAARGTDLEAARSDNEYIALDAEEVLATFMENGWPNEERFRQAISGIVDMAKQDGRRVRAFGEMVAVLWRQGHRGATVRLEHLWDIYCRTERCSVFCAYPRTGFPENASTAIDEICAAHSKVISGSS